MHTTMLQNRNSEASTSTVAPAARRRGVLLVNIGTPDAPDVAAVRRYLVEFLSDPHVIQLPPMLRWVRRPLARFIAWRRGPHSAQKYRLIWTERGSPLRTIMEDQAAALSDCLPDGWAVFLGMRYGQPSIEAALQEIARQGIEDLVVLPLYPQFSLTTTGTTVHEVYRVLKKHVLHTNVSTRTSWNNDSLYLDAHARLIADFAQGARLTPDDTHLLFAAHGLPVSYIQRGDPYERQLTESVRLIVERLGWPTDRLGLAYQSRMGPSEWLQPELTATLRELAGRGERRVLLCPISFAADCLETLEELHVRAHHLFASLGGELHVCPALNTNEHFVRAMRELIVRGPRPIVTWSRGHQPLLGSASPPAPADLGLDRLAMIGVTLGNRIGPGRGPQLAYSEPEGLACAKKPHEEVEAFLKDLKSGTSVSEAFVWNTCYRFECYAWLDSDRRKDEHHCVVATLRDRLFAAKAEGVRINTLFGRNAWHHLMRTIAGLNSGLPGDKDIVEQFRTAFRAAEQAGTAGTHARALVEQAVALVERVRRETSWGQLDPGYCYAALSRVQDQLPRKFANLRHVVVGSSTTSRSVLQALYERFEVKEPMVTLVYRSHQGGQMKLLRQAVGHGRRLRVQSYDEPSARSAILDADVVHFGIDRSEPVLERAKFNGNRNLLERPLYVIDFNTSGSTRDITAQPGVHLWNASQLDAEVEQFADALCRGEAFSKTVRDAEVWIEEQAPSPAPLSLELPCKVRDESGHPTCNRCGRALTHTGSPV